ncbi:MAG: MBL fold metallo-hydrolase [Nitrospiraceae bacterium]
MPEPSGTATLMGEILPGLYRWRMQDDRIETESDSYAVLEDDRVILIDPLPMEGLDLAELGLVESICLTGSCHERAAWRYRRQLNIPVYAPSGGVDFEEAPDRWYTHGDRLPGGLLAVHCPGPTDAYYSFHLERNRGVVFCADLLVNAGGETPAFAWDEYQDEPARTRDSVRRLLDLNFDVLCPAHGDPIMKDAKAAIRRALERDAAGRTAK